MRRRLSFEVTGPSDRDLIAVVYGVRFFHTPASQRHDGHIASARRRPPLPHARRVREVGGSRPSLASLQCPPGCCPSRAHRRWDGLGSGSAARFPREIKRLLGLDATVSDNGPDSAHGRSPFVGLPFHFTSMERNWPRTDRSREVWPLRRAAAGRGPAIQGNSSHTARHFRDCQKSSSVRFGSTAQRTCKGLSRSLIGCDRWPFQVPMSTTSRPRSRCPWRSR